MTNETPSVDPFAIHDRFDELGNRLREWVAEWERARKPLRDAIVIVEGFQESDSDFRDIKNISVWHALGAALRAVGLTEFPKECLPTGAEYVALNPNDLNCASEYLVWKCLADAVANELATLNASLETAWKRSTEEVFSAHFDSMISAIDAEWARVHIPSYLNNKLIPEAQRLGLKRIEVLEYNEHKPFGKTVIERRTIGHWLGSWRWGKSIVNGIAKWDVLPPGPDAVPGEAPPFEFETAQPSCTVVVLDRSSLPLKPPQSEINKAMLELPKAIQNSQFANVNSINSIGWMAWAEKVGLNRSAAVWALHRHSNAGRIELRVTVMQRLIVRSKFEDQSRAAMTEIIQNNREGRVAQYDLLIDGKCYDIVVMPSLADWINSNEPANGVVNYSELATLAKAMKGNERTCVELFSRSNGEIELATLKTEFEWMVPIESSWNSLRIRLTKKLKTHGWKVSSAGKYAIITRIQAKIPARKRAKKERVSSEKRAR